MELRIEGKLIQKLPVESGQSARGEWKKQNFIIETMEQFPRKVCIAAWTNSIPILESYQIGEMLSVGVNIESREFNGKWYTDVRVWRFDPVGAAAAPVSAPAQPVQQPMMHQTPPVTAPAQDYYPPAGEDSVDDLPFYHYVKLNAVVCFMQTAAYC